MTFTIEYLNTSDGKTYNLANIANARWFEMQRLLPLLVDYVNRGMSQAWDGGALRAVTINYETGTFHPKTNTAQPPNDRRIFVLNDFLRDNSYLGSSDVGEIVIVNLRELLRLFSWCDFLKQRDGVFELYDPVFTVLRRYTAGIERFTSGEIATTE